MFLENRFARAGALPGANSFADDRKDMRKGKITENKAANTRVDSTWVEQ